MARRRIISQEALRAKLNETGGNVGNVVNRMVETPDERQIRESQDRLLSSAPKTKTKSTPPQRTIQAEPQPEPAQVSTPEPEPQEPIRIPRPQRSDVTGPTSSGYRFASRPRPDARRPNYRMHVLVALGLASIIQFLGAGKSLGSWLGGK